MRNPDSELSAENLGLIFEEVVKLAVSDPETTPEEMARIREIKIDLAEEAFTESAEADMDLWNRFQKEIDIDPQNPDSLEAGFVRANEKLNMMNKACEDAALEFTKALSPLLEGDDPNEIKERFKNFSEFINRQRRGRQPS